MKIKKLKFNPINNETVFSGKSLKAVGLQYNYIIDPVDDKFVSYAFHKNLNLPYVEFDDVFSIEEAKELCQNHYETEVKESFEALNLHLESL